MTEQNSSRTIVLGHPARTFSFTGVSPEDPYLTSIGDSFEGNFSEFCLSYLRDNYVAFDVGANIGVTAALLSAHLPNGRVYAFEPAPSVHAALRENLARNKLQNVEAFQRAVSDKTGAVNFFDYSAYGHITADGGVSVPATTIDDVADELQLDRLDFIKIDVEGFEWSVLRGAEKTIARYKPLIYMEFNSWCLLAHSATNPLEFIRWVTKKFEDVYEVRKLSSGDLLIPLKDPLAFAHSNIINHGSVDDIVFTPDPSRFDLNTLAIQRAVDSQPAQVVHLWRKIIRLGKLKTASRMTAPLRWAKSKVR